MQFTVLVPGASAPAGINTIKSLRLSNFKGRIVATDSDALSAGFFLSDISEVMPESQDSLFIKRLLSIVKKYNVKVLFPSSGHDIYEYSKYQKELEEVGAKPIVSSRDTLEICRDKLLSFKKLPKKSKFVFTTTSIDKIHKFPIIAKPRFGKGGRDIFKIEDEKDLHYVTTKYDNMIFQDYLPGIEYTIDVLSDLHGNPLVSIPRIRLQTKAGISTKGRIIKDKTIENICRDTAKFLKIIGPCCIQLKESEDGELKMIEINPRMGGGTIFATLAGINFPSLIIDMVKNKSIKIPDFSEITVLRYYEEIVIQQNNNNNDNNR